ncbi:MAG: cellulose binding domain-containing protein, partial [Steroidobacter sp.]
WNGSYTQSGSAVTVKSLSYNGSIAAGGNVSGIGFTGNSGSTNAVPTSFAVNGTTFK